MMHDRQKLALSHALSGFLLGVLVVIFRIYSFNLPIMILGLLATGHLSQKLLKVRSYRIGGFLGWLLSGALTFVLWYLYAQLLMYNLLPSLAAW